MNKSSFWFALVYTVCLVLSIINIPIQLAGLPVKYYFMVILLAMCLFYRSHKFDKFFYAYLVFLFSYLLAGLNAGYVNNSIMKLLGTSLPSLILYKATTIMITRFEKLHFISVILLVVFVVDALVSIGQFYRDPFCMSLPTLLDIQMIDSREAAFYESVDMVGVGTVGLVGGVGNGYTLSAATILAWYPFERKSRLFIKYSNNNRLLIFNIVLCGLFLLASFYTQERAGFYLAVLFSLYLIFLIFRTNKGTGRVLFFALMLIIGIFAEYLYETASEFGRYSMGMEGQDRLDFIDFGFRFISQHPFGSIDLYMHTHPHMPHNLFVNMYVAGGWFGGTVILFIVLYQLYMCAAFILKTDKKKNWLPMLYVLMYLNITAQSLVHNSSIVYGGTLFLVFWGVASCYVEKKDFRRIIQYEQKYIKN